MQNWNTKGKEEKQLGTLSLKLEEVKHIRSVLSKAKIEVENIYDEFTLFIFFSPGALSK